MSASESAYQPKGLEDTYRGLGFETFRKLTDEEVQLLHTAAEVVWQAGPVAEGGVHTPAAIALMRENMVLGRFTRWRFGGVPDREVTQDDIKAYLRDYVSACRESDPDFGNLPPEIAEWDIREREGVYWIFDYLQYQDHTKPLTIDTYSLANLQFEATDIDNLVRRGVLELLGSYLAPDRVEYDVYALNSPYRDHLLVQWYGEQATG
jgi:hypothetical protein